MNNVIPLFPQNPISSPGSTSKGVERIDMLTALEVSEVLELSPEALIDLVNEGQLAAFRFGAFIRFAKSEVMALVDTETNRGLCEVINLMSPQIPTQTPTQIPAA